MFHDLTPELLERMQWLEARDSRDRRDGTPRNRRLRQIPRITGKFIALMAAGLPAGDCVEIGTSAGYSTLWLAVACRAVGRKVTTIEADENKVRLARETFDRAQVADIVDLVYGDARSVLLDHDHISFCFLDAEKEDYDDFYDLVIPRLVSGGLLVADNVISHSRQLSAVVKKAESDQRVDAIVVPIGKGELLCRKT